MNARHIRNSLLWGLASVYVYTGGAYALSISESPLFLTGSVQPLVMLDISKDQQLYKKAYNDYSDLDGDGQLETTYKHSINYYGYFDTEKCYTYDSGNKRFEPASVSATKYCTGQWSGNFLNWAAMSRMDAVRKLLYGGMRSQNRSNGDGNGINDGDTASSTVLERAFIPTDAHSWAKYYDGDDLDKLTPYSPPVTATTSSTSRTITNTGNNEVDYVFALASVAGVEVGDFVQLTANSNNYLRGRVTEVTSPNIKVKVSYANYAGSGTHASWTVENLSKRGITLCNTTLGGASPQNKSQTNTNLPRLRVAKGNFSLWNANERWQCRWSGEQSASNSNAFALSGIPAASSSPALATHGTGTGLGDYFVRVQACVSGLIHKEKCKTYPSGNFKPIGLLQVYGDTNQIYFGLMTGSYDNNISGGVLRKNVSTFTNEVNVNSDGTFTSAVGIVKTLDRMRIYGYYYGDGTYLGSDGDQCNFQLTNLTEGSCTSWGNPMAELYFESLRYFAGAGTATSAYTAASTKDTALGLPRPSWVQPLDNVNYCAPLNTLVFNASVSTNDFDLAEKDMAAIGASGKTAADLADVVGTGEGIAGNNYFIGSVTNSGPGNNELCDSKTVGNLGSIKGICPEGPTLLGSYLMPGMAHHARTNRIRSDLEVPDDDKKSLKVATYGVQLATNVPRIPIALEGESTPRVILQPIYRLNNSTPQGGGALVDMKILDQKATSTVATGTIYVNWEDSEQGGDYDQDVWGVIRYCLTTVAGGCGSGSLANTLKVTTDVVEESTNQPQGFGYTTSGTTQDGPHFHSGIEGFNFTDPTGVTGCTGCQKNDAATSVTYTLSGSLVAGVLQDPMYYAAKWGGFNDLDADGKPNSVPEWDSLKADGTPGSDGLPDNYFFVSNPLGLEIALNSAFLKILKDSSASAVATNSSTLNTGSRIYQGRFSSSFWSGQLLSYRIDTDGHVLSATSAPPGWDTADKPYPEWDAGNLLNSRASASSDTRLILTRGNTGEGADFQYANLSTAQKLLLDTDIKAQVDNCGPERVAYLRGHSGNEGTGTLSCATASAYTPMKFRTRSVSILGDIINSNPAYVGAPNAGYADADHPGYAAFRASFLSRKPVVYVGANDGMLHGFDVSIDATTKEKTTTSGNEVLAYVPSPVYSRLSALTDAAYTGAHRYLVDGSPMMADVCVSTTASCSTAWKTVLVGGLGGGGRGFYALNVTNPDIDGKNTPDTPTFTLANASNILLWEFTNSDDGDLGLTYNLSPIKLNNGQSRQIAKFQNGRWGVVLGNGYNSASGKAVLYILFMSGPTGADNTWLGGGVDFVKIEADAGPNNGLSTPVPFDKSGDGLVDVVYAGDITGKMWKFDLSSADPEDWGVANAGAALFDAGTSKPITTPPEVTLHPAGGTMVLFGTGKYLENSDNNLALATTQSFYGIHDTNVVVTVSDLIQQKLSSVTINDTTFRTTACDVDTENPNTPLPLCSCIPASEIDADSEIDYVAACPTSDKGWYVNLPTTGERATGSPKLVSGIIIFNTFIPSVSPCDFGGTGWLMGLNYLNGKMMSSPKFDTDDSNSVTAADIPVAGIQVGAALGGTTLIKTAPTADNSGVVGVSSTTEGTLEETPPIPISGFMGRINWREIMQ
jgi:type IV pilus assembly protein PilY1